MTAEKHLASAIQKHQAGDFYAAIEECNAAIDLNPYLAAAYYYRGNNYTQLGEFELAIDDYSHTIALVPNYVDAYFNRASAHAQLEQYAEAVTDYRHYLALGGGEDLGLRPAVEEWIRDLESMI